MRSRSLLVVIAVLAAAAIVAGYFITHRESDNVILASGTIEATDVDVSFQIAGRVTEVLALEGQPVKAGDVLARLSAEELTQRVKQIQASLEAAVSHPFYNAALEDQEQDQQRQGPEDRGRLDVGQPLSLRSP